MKIALMSIMAMGLIKCLTQVTSANRYRPNISEILEWHYHYPTVNIKTNTKTISQSVSYLNLCLSVLWWGQEEMLLREDINSKVTFSFSHSNHLNRTTWSSFSGCHNSRLERLTKREYFHLEEIDSGNAMPKRKRNFAINVFPQFPSKRKIEKLILSNI